MRVIVAEVGEKYPNLIHLVTVMPIEYADELNEGWERKNWQGQLQGFYGKPNMICTIYQEGRFREGQAQGDIKGSVWDASRMFTWSDVVGYQSEKCR